MAIWAVGGGKGGTGKSLIANGLGLGLAERGARVVLVDADFGGPNQHTYCGIRKPARSLAQFFENGAALEELLLDTAVPGMEEFAPELRRGVLEEVEAAFGFLCGLRRETQAEPAPAQPAPAPVPAPGQPAVAPGRSGLCRAREAAGLSLEQLAAETHVRQAYLKALEEEHFENLRLAAVIVRGYLTAYAQAVGLRAEQVVPPYLEKYLQWQSRQPG